MRSAGVTTVRELRSCNPPARANMNEVHISANSFGVLPSRKSRSSQWIARARKLQPNHLLEALEYSSADPAPARAPP